MAIDISFLAGLGPNDVILTPNQRLANTLLHALQEHHLAQGQLAFAPPLLLSFSQFIRLLWKSFLFLSPKKLLSKDEEQWLWQTILAASSTGNDLLNTQQAAALVQKAWHDLTQWQLNCDCFASQLASNDNLHFFSTWAQQFATLCSDRNFIDESSALAAYTSHPTFIKNLPYQNIYFYHFLEMTPLQQHFIATLKNERKDVTIIEQASINQELYRFELETPTDELTAMAQWAQEKHAENPNLKIGCVIPTLHQQRNAVLRTFKTVFNTQTPPIDISAGYLLSEFTLIQHMLLIMALRKPMFDYEVFSTYLRSAYFGASEEEMAARHLLDIALRKTCSKTTSLQKIMRSSAARPYINALITKEHIPSQPLHHWCTQWLDLLTALGWPGQRNLNSTEYQVTQRFIKLIQEIEGFCVLKKKWTWQEFSSLVKNKCQQTVFQPEAEKTSIQILGLLEASGMTFDYLWVMGLDNKTWPSSPAPNPFLPYALQKKHGMPHASAEREYAFCQDLQANLIASSTSVIISSAKHNEDKELSPSPLITKIPMLDKLSIEVSSQRRLGPSLTLKNTDEKNINIEYITDNLAPPVSSHEKISGGTSIIQQQAICPFKAFAKIRLKADEIETPTDVPDSRIRGNRIHRALELFWKDIKTSEKLTQLSDQALDISIQHAVTTTYAEQAQENVFFTELEKTRLAKLMHAWLAVEKQRPRFTVIAIEQKRQYHYKNITLRMRVDRIDELENGRHVIIDYKTSKPNIQHWLGSRIKEPQLPIYCISHTADVEALYFAQLRWNELTIKGMADGASEIRTVTAFEKLSPEMRAPNWAAQKVQWKNNIDHLLEDFLQGNATVDPIDQTACTHCHLHALCRVFEHE